MNDDQLKREIEDALSIEPSPQFAARVRARIGESPRRSRLWIRSAVAAAAGLAAAAVVTVVFFEPQESGISTPVKPLRIEAKIQRELEDVTVLPPPPATPVAVRRPAAVPPSRAQEPEVLIDPREVAAFRKFVEGVQANRIHLKMLIELQQAAAKPATIEEIALMPIGDLDPIVIESLTFGPRRIEGGSL